MTIIKSRSSERRSEFTVVRTEERVYGGQNEESIMLNIDTFKNICMLAKTEKAKNIRKYYIKLR